MPKVARVGDIDDDGPDTISTGSPNVFANENEQPGVITPIPPEPPTTPRLVVPPVVISPDVQEAVDARTADYINDPEKYKQDSAVTNNQVKENYAGTPEGGGAGGGGAGPSAPAGTSLIDPNATGEIPSFLSTILEQSNKGLWSETGMGGQPSNPRILNIWKELGYPQTGAWTTDQTAWCMGFVNWVLKNTGHRFVQTARAKDIRARASDYKAQSIPLDQGQPGDIALWSYSHVNFIYTASGGTYTFVGGNQSDKARNANNPSGGSATKSWPTGYRTPGNGSLVGIWRPVKS